jgi:hypothetical protein
MSNILRLNHFKVDNSSQKIYSTDSEKDYSWKESSVEVPKDNFLQYLDRITEVKKDLYRQYKIKYGIDQPLKR